MWVKKTTKWETAIGIVLVILLIATYALLVGATANELRP